MLLKKIQRDAGQHNHRDDEKIRHFAQQGGNHAGQQQNQYEWISEMREILPPKWGLALFDKAILTVAPPHLGGLLRA